MKLSKEERGIKQWTSEEVCKWFESTLSLPQYIPELKNREINGERLVEASKGGKLKELGIIRVKDLIMISSKINKELKGNTAKKNNSGMRDKNVKSESLEPESIEVEDCLDVIDFGTLKDNNLTKEDFSCISETIFPSFKLEEGEQVGLNKFLDHFYASEIFKEKKVEQGRISKKFASEFNLHQLEFIHKKSPLLWNVYHVGSWLKTQGFPEYKKLFFENHIDGEKIVELSESDLSKMGVIKNRRKLFLKIIDLKRILKFRFLRGSLN